MEDYLDELLELHLADSEPLADEPPDDGCEF